MPAHGTMLTDADDVVMEESRTYRDEETGAALMQVQVSRAHDNTAGTLWSNGTNQEYYETHPGACQTTAIRFGYAGYVRDGSVNSQRNYTDVSSGLYHVRHRLYDPELGRWTRRDPIGYVDGLELYTYVSEKRSKGLIQLV